MPAPAADAQALLHLRQREFELVLLDWRTAGSGRGGGAAADAPHGIELPGADADGEGFPEERIAALDAALMTTSQTVRAAGTERQGACPAAPTSLRSGYPPAADLTLGDLSIDLFSRACDAVSGM